MAAKGIFEEDAFPCPDWYGWIVAADRCHCPPWELMGQGIYWKDKAIIASSAENSARKQLKAMGM